MLLFSLFSTAANRRRYAAAPAVALFAGLMLAAAQSPAHAQAARVVASPSPSPSASPSAPAKEDILAVLKSAGKYTSFLKALEASGLASTLSQPGPYTVFAPTDEAFSKLPAGTLDSLLKAENKTKLIAVINYHIAPGKVTIAALSKMEDLKTLSPESIDVDTASDGKTIEMDDLPIVAPDMEASNGLIQGISGVLQP
jgi:uncharacterized surface protein with fasciclin (FAS1) repeats